MFGLVGDDQEQTRDDQRVCSTTVAITAKSE
jgi:hypothetical protein